MEPLLRLAALEKAYGKKTAVRLENLVIKQGCLYLLTGPNGSGKSTLLSVMAFLTRPEQGEMFWKGERVAWTSSTLNRLRKQVTLLHQSPYLFCGTVFDNVAFGMKRHGVCRTELHRRSAKVLADVGLEGYDNRSAAALSGGEAQRVALARALAIEPTMLLLDEPLASVDRQSARKIEEVITSLPSRGTTVIFSSHDPDHECRMKCERIRLVDGILEEPSTLNETEWEEPAYACL